MRVLMEDGIGEVWVEGEVSNLKKQASGHWYFSLKDENAQIQCAMFAALRKPGSRSLRDGARARVLAEASVYETRGQLQLIVSRAEEAGQGELQARFEELKRRLQAEGLFDTARKRPLPRFPLVVGVITSDTGAVLRDILHVLGRRAPWIQPVLLPVRVQGKGAEKEIAAAIRILADPASHSGPPCEVLIIGRGGGSLEDLWCFNEEIVARAIAACPLPVISAVGHETDFTIADFAADLRAPTPSAAAEMVAPDGAELRAMLAQLQTRMTRAAEHGLERARAVVGGLRRGPLRADAERILREPMLRVDALRGRLEQNARLALSAGATRLASVRARHASQQPLLTLLRRAERLAEHRERLNRAAADSVRRIDERLLHLGQMLRTLGPESAFKRGFSITLGPDGKALRSASDAGPGVKILTKLADGELSSIVE